MSRIRLSGDWGELVDVNLDEPAEGRELRLQFTSTGTRHTLFAVASTPDSIVALLANGEPVAVRQENGTFIAVLEGLTPGATVDVTIVLREQRGNVFVGWLRKAVVKGQAVLDQAVRRFKDRCFACKMMVRGALMAVTGGLDDVTFEALDAMAEALAEKLEEYFGETVFEDLKEALDVARKFGNPKKVVAAVLCTRLGYCKDEVRRA